MASPISWSGEADENSQRRGHPTSNLVVKIQFFLPPGASSKVAIRKPTNRSKRKDPGEPNAPSARDGSTLGLKSKPSTNPIPPGAWRPGTLHLVEEDRDAKLQVISEEQSLQLSVDLRQLRSTHIRLADKSRLKKNNVLGIYCTSNDGISSSSYTKPIYIQFASRDSLNTWLVLLRTFTIPETYGTNEEPLYRIWRQLQIEIVQANNIGVIKPVSATNHSPVDQNDEEQALEGEAIDMDLFCEIVLNNETVGVTEVQPGIGNSVWYQTFTFSDLPTISSLHVHVYRMKRSKQSLLGTAFIPVEDCHHGDLIEGWIAVLSRGEGRDGHYLQVGDVKIKYKVEEEIILPQHQYSGLLKIIDSKNIFELLAELETRLQLKTLAPHVVTITMARDKLMDEVKRGAEREIDGSLNSHTTLFRGNSVLTKAIEKAMVQYGSAWLEKSVGDPVRKIIERKLAIETDPNRRNKSLKDHEQNVKALVDWCTLVWRSIYDAREDCPMELRIIFNHIRVLVDTKYAHEHDEVKWQAVSAFVFLRFFVPAILKPHLFGITPGLPSQPVQRSLTLIGKVIQSLANLKKDVQKEEHLRKAKDFIMGELQAMMDYLVGVSTLKAEQRRFPADLDLGQTDRLHIMQTISRQLSILPPLHRESIPHWPHMIDVPQQLALITSMIVRNCKNIDGEVISNITGPASSNTLAGIGEFVCQCLNTETLALQQVNNVARLATDSKEMGNAHQNHPSVSTTAAGHDFYPAGSSTDLMGPSRSASQSAVQRTAELTETMKLIRRKPAPKVTDIKAAEQADIQPSQSSSSFMTPLDGPYQNGSGKSSPTNGSDSELVDGKKRKVPWSIFRK